MIFEEKMCLWTYIVPHVLCFEIYTHRYKMCLRNTFFISFQMYAADLCRSFCELLKDITTEGQVQVLKVERNKNYTWIFSSIHRLFLLVFCQVRVIFSRMMNVEHVEENSLFSTH